jgi:predicted CoA-substrate-specific enzyme activase
MVTMGIDIGSASSKVVILKDGADVAAWSVVQFGTGSTGPKRALDQALEQAKIALDDIAFIMATGYGRNSCEWSGNQMSEISCHARGIFHLIPSARTIIDIGGQDAKAIRLGEGGMVNQFAMNEKCAAGTGRFLEVMARVLEVKLEEMEAWHDKAASPASISSTCTVFAESEVISQLSKGTSKADIIAGVHVSVASRACSLARRVGLEMDVVMSGGVAQNSGVVKSISDELSVEVKVAPNPQIIGALGASLYAYDNAKKNH